MLTYFPSPPPTTSPPSAAYSQDPLLSAHIHKITIERSRVWHIPNSNSGHKLSHFDTIDQYVNVIFPYSAFRPLSSDNIVQDSSSSSRESQPEWECVSYTYFYHRVAIPFAISSAYSTTNERANGTCANLWSPAKVYFFFADRNSRGGCKRDEQPNGSEEA